MPSVFDLGWCVVTCLQILAMSATVKNPEALGGWIGEVHGPCETVKTQFRPVPLQWGFAHKAPRRGALLEDLLLEPTAGGKQPQKQQSNQRRSDGKAAESSSNGGGGSGSSLAAGGSGIGLSLNPGLKLDLWIHQELK
jgi:superfamily II RNA helicase